MTGLGEPVATASDKIRGDASVEATAPQRPSLKSRFASSSFGILGHRDFGLFWFAALISSAGNWMQLIAVPALMFELTHSATWVGAVTVAGTLPTVLLVPYAGVLADRVSPRPYLAVVQIAQMIVAIAFFVGYQADSLTRLSVLVLIAINGCATGLLMPAWQIFLPKLVPPERLPDAVRLNSMQFTAARVFGPTTAAIVIGLGSLQLAFLLNALSFVGVLLALMVVRPRLAEHHVVREKAFRVFVDGARYAVTEPAIRVGVIVAAGAAVLGMSIQQQAASIASQLYGRPSTASAGLLTATGIGSLLAVMLIVARGSRLPPSKVVLGCLMVYAVASFTMAMSHYYGLGLAGFMLNGFAMSGISLTVNTIILSHAEPRYRGRAISFYLLAVIGGLPIGAMGSGFVADHSTMRTAILGMGALMVVLMLVCVAKGLHEFDESPVVPSQADT